MGERTATRRAMPYLVAGWIFAAASIVVFAWLTAGSYVRQTLRPLPGEAGLAVRECTADPACAPDAAGLVDHQVTLLGQTRTVVYLSAWSISILAVVAIAIATVLVLRRPDASSARLLGVLWKVQIGSAAVLLVVQVVLLAIGANVFAGTPEPARMFAAIKAFDAPFTDVGNLYYLAWFAGVGLVAALLTRALRKTI